MRINVRIRGMERGYMRLEGGEETLRLGREMRAGGGGGRNKYWENRIKRKGVGEERVGTQNEEEIRRRK